MTVKIGNVLKETKRHVKTLWIVQITTVVVKTANASLWLLGHVHLVRIVKNTLKKPIVTTIKILAWRMVCAEETFVHMTMTVILDTTVSWGKNFDNVFVSHRHVPF